MTPTALGTRVLELRKLRGWTQDELALRVKRSKQTISRLEKGKQNLKLSEILAVAEALEVPVSELFIEPEQDSGEFRVTKPRDVALSLFVDSVMELSEKQRKEVYFVLSLVLEGRVTVENHAALHALLREGVTVR